MESHWNPVSQVKKHKMNVDSPSSSQMRKDGIFVDAILKDKDGGEWKIHKVVISRLGLFVFNALTHPTFDGTLSLNISSDIAQAIIDFAYKGVCDISAENVLDIYSAALMYQFVSLMELCGEFVIENMTPEDALTVRRFVETLDCGDEVRRQVDRFIVRNFSEVCLDEKIFELEFEELVKYLEDDYLNIPEKDLLEGLMVMIKNNKKLDQEKAIELLGYVRHSLINPEDYCQSLEKEDTLKDQLEPYTRAKILVSVNEKSRALELKMNTKGKYKSKEDYAQLTEQRKELRREKSKWSNLVGNVKVKQQHRHPRDVVIAIGGTESSYGTKNLEIFNVRTNNWTKVQFRNDLVAGFSKGHGLVLLGHTLYHLGGLFVQPLKSVEALDLLEGKWMSKEEMAVSRFGVTAVAWRNGIVAFGGSTGDDFGIVDTAEFYDQEKDKWCKFPSLTRERSGAAGVVVEDRIFAIGGLGRKERVDGGEDTEDISEIEYYDPDTSKWEVCGQLKVARNAARAVYLDGKVYVFGGRTEMAMETGEYFEPVVEKGKILLVGSSIIKMPRKRKTFGMSVVNNKIMFTGGDHVEFVQDPNVLNVPGPSKECAVFCPRTGEWRDVKSMDCAREYHKSITVDTTNMGIEWIKKLVTKLKPEYEDDEDVYGDYDEEDDEY